MALRKKPQGEAYQRLVESYYATDHKGKVQLAKNNKISPGTLKHWIADGDTPVQQGEVITIETKIAQVKPLPAINIIPIPQESKEEGEEAQVVLLSDLQAGQQSPTFNSKILKQEMIGLAEKTMRLCQLHRRMRPIKKLYVCLLGDIIENMNVPIPSLEELESVVYDQIFDVAVPCLNDFLVSLSQIFEEIEVYCVRGNHGQLEGRRSLSARTNWDTFVYRILALGLKNYDRIHFHIEENNFWQIANIMGHKCLLVHGDQIPTYMGIPFYGVDRRTLRWNVNIPGGWTVCFMGHFHVTNYIRPSGIPIFMNGTFTSGTSYPLHRLGLLDEPRQFCLFISPKRGVTAIYEMRVNEK